MKALTARQPWCWALFNGLDTLWEPFPGKPQDRGYFLIHAGLGFDYDAVEWLRDHLHKEVPLAYMKQVSICGYARLTRVGLRADRELYPDGGFLFYLTDIQPLPPQVAAGRRGFWVVPQRVMSVIDLPQHVLDQAM